MFCGATDAMHDINDLMTELDRQSSLAADRPDALHKHWVARRQQRYPYRVNCAVRIFVIDCTEPIEIPARTRNLSRGGVGLLMQRVLSVNEPVEVEIPRGPGKTLYMAGLVRFCRYAGMGFHEVGIELKATAGASIFPKTAGGALSILEWLQKGVIWVATQRRCGSTGMLLSVQTAPPRAWRSADWPRPYPVRQQSSWPTPDNQSR